MGVLDWLGGGEDGSWWSDLWGGFTGEGGEGIAGIIGTFLGGQTGNPAMDSLLGMGLASIMQNQGWGDPKIPQVGYQGKIPNYAAVRQRVPMQPDSNRRPGAAGRRYFSDTLFADAPERQPLTIADAEAQTRQQAEGLASLMPTYSAPTEEASKHFVSSNPASSVINTTPVDTMEKDEDEDAIDTGGFTGGVMSAGGMYLGGATDGMADRVRGNVSGDEVRLSDGEFVIPADIVSHLGNGNSNAGASFLYDFMKDVRKERTGNPKQGKQINPNQFLRG